jgi:hypothetical protein
MNISAQLRSQRGLSLRRRGVDDASLAARVDDLSAYCPPPDADGRLFRVAAHRPMDRFPYFHHALFVRQDTGAGGSS